LRADARKIYIHNNFLLWIDLKKFVSEGRDSILNRKSHRQSGKISISFVQSCISKNPAFLLWMNLIKNQPGNDQSLLIYAQVSKSLRSLSQRVDPHTISFLLWIDFIISSWLYWNVYKIFLLTTAGGRLLQLKLWLRKIKQKNGGNDYDQINDHHSLQTMSIFIFICILCSS